MAKLLPTKLIKTIDCKQNTIRAVRFNVDGNYILSCGSDNTLKLLNPIKGNLLATYSGHGQEVLDACGACDNAQMASGSLDKTVILWDVADARVIRKFRGHAGSINCVRFNEDSTVILSGSLDCTVRIWDCKSNRVVQVLDEAKDSITSLWVTDYEILTGSCDGKLRRYDIRNGQLYEDFIAKDINSVAMSRDGQCLLVSSLDSKIRLMDKQTGELLNEYKGHKNIEFKIDSTFNNHDTHIVSGSEDFTVYIWDLLKGNISAKLLHKTRVISSLTMHPKNSMMVTSGERNVFVWSEDDNVT